MSQCIRPYGFQCFLQVINLSILVIVFSSSLFSLEQFTHKHISVHKRLFFLHIHLLWVHPVLQRHKLSSTTVSGTGGFFVIIYRMV